jgi:hypothetical protein
MRRPRCKEGVKMPKLKVRVVKLEARQGQTGSYAIVHLEGGKRAYVWDRALVQSLGPGLYEVEVEERKKVLRLVSAKPISNGAQGHEERPQEASTASEPSQERMVALQLAVALAPHLGLTDVGQVLTVAERMMRWLLRGLAMWRC